MEKKKVLAIIMLVTVLFSTVNSFAHSIPIQYASIINKGECERILQFNDPDSGWYNIICYYNAYVYNGVEYPAYCLNPKYPGVGELPSYDVDTTALLDDPVLWRTYKNGFPYKSAAQLGVDNDFDAYLATKHAAYCIIFDRNPEVMYRGANERGDRIHKAMINIVNAGKYGTEMPNSATVQINKVGTFEEEGNYYIQKFDVASNSEIKSYTITSTNNLPIRTIITNTSGEEKTTFNAGEQFVVRIPKSRLHEDISSIINVQVACKSYPIFYGRTATAGTQDYAVTFDPFADEVGRVNLDIKTNTGKIVINKIDSETKTPIAGVTFLLTKNIRANMITVTATTNENGIAEFSNLYQGSYLIREVQTNEDYILNSEELAVSATYNKTTEITVTNEHKKGNLKVNKVDKDNNKISLGNVKFELYSEELKRIIGAYTTDVNGEIYIENLRTGDYKLKETDTNKWYNLSNDTEVKVEWDKTSEITIENELKKGQIKVVKVDLDNQEVKLKGVKFDVLDSNGNILETIVTDENGEAITSKYAVRDFPNLILRESETLENYVLNSTSETITLEADKIVNLTFTNEAKKGQIKVVKVDLDNQEVKLKDVEFNILDNEGNIVDKLVTDENGEAISKKLRIDKEYTIQEVKTLDNYKLNNAPQKIVLKENEITNITFTNEKRKGQIEVIKIDEENNEVKLEGVEFNILDSNGNLVDTIITNKDGKAITKKLPIDDEYIIQETKTLNNYLLTEDTQKVTLEENQITSIVFENKKIKGNIELTKVDKDYPENHLMGAIFYLYQDTNDNGSYDKEDIFISELEEKENGKYELKDIEYGRYFIKEIKAPENYILDEEYYEVFIKENGITYNVETEVGKGFGNCIMSGNLKIVKTSEDGKLKGFTFKIVGIDIRGNSIEQEYTTENNGVIYIENLPIGEYTISEVENKTSKKYIIPEPQIVKITNQETSEVSFYNELIKTPNTGDISKINVYVVIVTVSMVSLLIIFVIRRKI